MGGVSGPSIITDDFRLNRDIFKYKKLKKLYDWFFLEGMEDLPGHITHSGTWTTGANNASCMYDGTVDFLEACNMAYRSDIFKQVGGFDESFKGVGDWSEPDLSFRVRKAGWRLWFNRNAKLYHKPSRTGAFSRRIKDSSNRIENYMLFASRHVRPSWRNTMYKLFLRSYYFVTSIK